jgi:hypothetical protein
MLLIIEEIVEAVDLHFTYCVHSVVLECVTGVSGCDDIGCLALLDTGTDTNHESMLPVIVREFLGLPFLCFILCLFMCVMFVPGCHSFCCTILISSTNIRNFDDSTKSASHYKFFSQPTYPRLPTLYHLYPLLYGRWSGYECEIFFDSIFLEGI